MQFGESDRVLFSFEARVGSPFPPLPLLPMIREELMEVVFGRVESEGRPLAILPR